MLCSQYGEITLTCVFLQELTPPLHPAPGTTRSDVTLARECQRLCVVVLYFGGMFDCSSPIQKRVERCGMTKQIFRRTSP